MITLENSSTTFKAKETDWSQLNKINIYDIITYCGNYFKEDSTDVYAVFITDEDTYAIQID